MHEHPRIGWALPEAAPNRSLSSHPWLRYGLKQRKGGLPTRQRFDGCLRCLLLVMCTHPFAKEALTLHLARSEGHELYFGCNLMHRKVLASSHQHLMAEAPTEAPRLIACRADRG